MNQEWKDVVGYEGLYQVSIFGKVKNSRRRRIVVGRESDSGYKIVTLTKDRKTKGCPVHRLVAMAFIENPGNKPFVNHKNGVRNDNNLSNLEWCTHQENMVHAQSLKQKKNELKMHYVQPETLEEMEKRLKDEGRVYKKKPTMEDRRRMARQRLTELHLAWRAKQNQSL